MLQAITLFSFNRQEPWVLFHADKCQVLFPQKPTHHSQTLNTAIGKLALTIYVYEVADAAKDDNLVYLLSESDYIRLLNKFRQKADIRQFLKTFH